MAPLSCAFGEAMYVYSIPTLIVSGGSDELVPFDTIATRPQVWAPGPLEVAKLVGGTHVGFGAICATQYTQTMRASRQVELSKAAALAQFESVLRGNQSAAAYLATAFAAQNDDVVVTHRQ